MRSPEQQPPAGGTHAGPKELDTPRLAMRRLTADDAAFFLALVTDPAWIRFIGDRNVHTVEEARRSLVEGPIAMYGRTGHGLLRVDRRADGAPLGICGLIRRDTLPDIDLGFALLPEHRGRGYAAEAARASIAHARDELRLRRLVAIATPENVDSRRLLEHLGLRHERTYTLPGATQPSALHAIEWP